MNILQIPSTGDSLELGFQLFGKFSSDFYLRLAIDLLFVVVLIRGVYLPKQKKQDFLFTFFVFNVIIFLITYFMNRVEMSMGAAFGLFAVFSMLHYRTEGISIKDMTYLFLVIAMGLLTAISQASWIDLLILNSFLVLLILILENNVLYTRESTKTITYEKIDLIRPENKEKLMQDLKERTGLKIHRISITKIDFLKDVARIKIYYHE